ncbi:MAG: hypothetical protein DME19_17620 [Verrucomicrobia bacterium]|nr:MAG: hypothetical protein DME19_17620 [Verrucomicrobiota bacterium]
MGVDQTGQQQRFPQVDGGLPGTGPQILPSSDRLDAIAGNPHRAIVNRRLCDRKNDTGTKEHERNGVLE